MAFARGFFGRWIGKLLLHQLPRPAIYYANIVPREFNAGPQATQISATGSPACA
jgi:hypothetical protein